MSVNIGGIVCVSLLYGLIMAVGMYAAWSKRKVKTKNESEIVMVAQRDIGWVLGSFTMIATWVGGGYINGSAEAIYSPGTGLVWTQAPLGLSLSLIIGALFLAKKMRDANYFTMLDPLQNKLGRTMGAILYLPAFVGDMFWSASILKALGSTIAVIINFNITIAIIISACISTLYTLVGGLYAVAYTDVVQLICMFFGLFLVIPFAMMHSAVQPIAHTFYMTGNSTGWCGEWIPELSGKWFDVFFMLIGGGIPFQAYFQRVLSCQTAQKAQILSIIGVFGCLIVTIPAIIIGAVAASTDWNQTSYGLPTPFDRGEASSILPIVLYHLTPRTVSAIGLAAVSAAVMSSTDSIILASSTMLSKNVYKGLLRKSASDREMIWALRASIVVLGTISCTMAITLKSVYNLLVLCADFVYVALFPQLMGVLYLDINTYGSLPAFILAFVLRLGGGEATFGMKPYIDYPGGDNFPFRTFAMLISTFVLISFSYLTRYLFSSGIVPAKYDVFQCKLAAGGRTRYFNEPDESFMTEDNEMVKL